MKLFRSILYCGLLACVQATPLSRVNRRAVTVSPQDFSNFQLFAQYAAASYCEGNINHTNPAAPAPITCENNACPLVQAAKAESVIEFAEDGTLADVLLDAPGYVAVDTTHALIIISFRGTHSVRDLLTDITPELTDSPICNNCQVHLGFDAAFAKHLVAVETSIEDAKIQYPDFSIVVTGHSLGGAIATIAGAWIRSVMKFPCDIYTFGSPRVGNDHFVNYVSDTSMGHTYRVTHLNDPIPQIPPGGWLTGYYHTTPEYWLGDGQSNTDNYKITDINVCEGIDNGNCNAGQLPDITLTAHFHYFEDVTKCTSGFTVKREVDTR